MAVNLARYTYDADNIEFYVAANRIREDMTWISEHVPLPAPARFPLLTDEEYVLRVRRTIKRAVADIKPDLIHVHTQTIVPPRDVPSLVTVHGTYQRELPYLRKYPLPQPYKLFQLLYTYNVYGVERFCLGHFDRYHVTSTRTREEILSMGVKDNVITHVPIGVGLESIRSSPVPDGLLEKYGIPATGKMVLSVGAMVTRKGHHVVAEAAKRVLEAHPDAEFVFIGPISKIGHIYIRKMRENAVKARVPVEKLHFLGALPEDELIGFYNACRVYASGSLVEGFGLNVVEAATCGKPVVSNDVGAVKDVLGDLGTVVPIGDQAAFAEGIIGALDGPAHIAGLSEQVTKNLSWKKIGRDMADLYREVAGLKN